jgi:hypothetical protein
MAMNPGLAAYIAKKKGGKPADKKDPKAKDDKGGNPFSADNVRSNKLKELAKAGGK